MNLDTVKILSRNPAIRGKYFDVYWHSAGNDIALDSVERVDDVNNIIPTLDGYSIDCVKAAIDAMLFKRRLTANAAQFTPDQITAGYLSDAKYNAERGWSND